MSVGQSVLTGGFAGLQTAISNSIGSLNVPGAFKGTLQANPANTTTALSLTLVVNGIPQGLVRSMTIDEQFNQQRVRAIGSAINVAFLPGVYEATAQIDKAFLYGQTMETAFGGGIRAVIGKYLSDSDFTKFYFNICEVDLKGKTVATRHDCVLTSLRKAYEIDNVVIMESASILIRWSESE